MTFECPKNIQDIFTYPHPLNVWDVRIKAGFALVYIGLSVALDLLAGFPWASFYLLFYFVIRLLSGPLFSWEAWFVLWISPKMKFLQFQYVPGPPKRFSLFCGSSFIIAAILVRYHL